MTVAKPKTLPEARGLSRCNAAHYVGVSPSLFDLLVADGRMPKPKEINSLIIWDKFELDQAFENLPTRGGRNPWDKANENDREIRAQR